MQIREAVCLEEPHASILTWMFADALSMTSLASSGCWSAGLGSTCKKSTGSYRLHAMQASSALYSELTSPKGVWRSCMYRGPNGFLLCLFFSMSSLVCAMRLAVSLLEAALLADIAVRVKEPGKVRFGNQRSDYGV